MPIPRILRPPALSLLETIRLNRELEIQELQAALDVDRQGATLLLLLRYLVGRDKLGGGRG